MYVFTMFIATIVRNLNQATAWIRYISSQVQIPFLKIDLLNANLGLLT